MTKSPTVNEDRERAQLFAFHNTMDFIDLAARLPSSVFSNAWNYFWFFESDRMFAPEFVGVTKEMLLVEGASVCCLLNLSRSPILEYQAAAAIYIESTTEPEDYRMQLYHGGPADGWIYAMERYACASDKNEWCIYCERSNDIALLALRYPTSAERFRSQIRLLWAEPIANLRRSDGVQSSPPFNALTETWRSSLLKSYGDRGL